MIFQVQNCDLFCQHDWRRVQYIYRHLGHMIDQDMFCSNKKYEPAYRATLYSINGHGCVAENVTLCADQAPWRIWTGSMLEHVIPWAKSLRQRLERSSLRFVNFSYFSHSGLIASHIDGKSDLDRAEGHCNINYIIAAEDPNAYTHVGQNEDIRQYRSTAGNAWLLDTSVPHGVMTNGRREIFQMTFHSPFADVKNFLETTPNLFNGWSDHDAVLFDAQSDPIIDFLDQPNSWSDSLPDADLKDLAVVNRSLH